MNAEIEQKQYEADELTDRLENAEREQKELFLILFQVSFLMFCISVCYYLDSLLIRLAGSHLFDGLYEL